MTTLGILLAISGLALMSFNGGLLFNLGDFLVFLSAISLASHILLVDKYVKDEDAILFAILQIATVALLSSISAGIEGSYTLDISLRVWLSIIAMALLATALAFVVQNKAQQFTTPTRTAIIFIMEPVFGAIFAYLYLGEIIATRAYWGGFLIVLGMLFSEMKFDKSNVFSKRLVKKNR